MADVFHMRLLTEAQIRNRYGLSVAIRILLVVVLLTGIFGSSDDMSFWQPTPLLGKFAVTGFLLIVLLGIAESIDALASTTYKWLPRYGCGVLADDCERYPGLQPYRDAVCASGRRFTMGEYRAMRAWARAQQEKVALAEAAAYLAEKAAQDLADSHRLYGCSASYIQLQ